MKALTATEFNFPGQEKACTTEKFVMCTTSMVKSWSW